MPPFLLITHGGVSAPLSTLDGCRLAADRAAERLAAGEGAIAAAIVAVETLEADGRYCAGAGSSIRLDGHTVEMDAALHTSTGLFRAVAALSDTPHPIRVVERLLDTPPCFLAGDGARRFAARHGLTAPMTPTARARRLFRRVAERAARGRLEEEYPRWRGVDLAANWNFAREIPDYGAVAAAWAEETADTRRDGGETGASEPGGRTIGGGAGAEGGACDTVGVVIFDPTATDADERHPRFVAAVSTGGTAAMLMGRVGDSPLPGCGLYAGPAGAVTVTGEGEEIIRRMLSRWIYDRLAEGVAPDVACRESLALFRPGTHVGAIAVTERAVGSAASDPMPVAAVT